MSATEKPLVAIVPSYNNSQWVERNLTSIYSQKYTNYRVIYINDASTDDTLTKVQELVTRLEQAHRTTIINNETNKGALYNLYHAIWSCNNEEVVMTIDGDDWLKHNKVFASVNTTYQDPNTWMTYGSYEHYPPRMPGICAALPKWVIQEKAYRTQPWVTSHLRTFYAWLFKQVKKEDLQLSGDFFRTTWDLAFMFPLLEMAGDHVRYIEEILYVYNIDNPINDFKVRLRDQLMFERYLRTRPQYETLEKPIMVVT